MITTRIDQAYAWGECEYKQCRNTVKFADEGSVGCCPACSSLYVISGNTATKTGHVDHGNDLIDDSMGEVVLY